MNETNAALNRYLLEIGRIPLLSPDQEIELARRIQNGDAAARELMINANLRLVVTIAGDYINLGLPLVDLISEGKHRINESRGPIRSGKRRQAKHLRDLVDQAGDQRRTCRPEQNDPIASENDREN